tara:strand:+ start:27 stop:491 length:465 start_codon:yes stop_codon:yes gene_type:complete
MKQKLPKFLSSLVLVLVVTAGSAHASIIDQNITCVSKGRWSKGSEVTQYNNIGDGVLLIQKFKAFRGADTTYTRSNSVRSLYLENLRVENNVIIFSKNLKLNLDTMERIKTTTITAPYPGSGPVTRTKKDKCVHDFMGVITEMTKQEMINAVGL